tara:strand:- start:742 stop:1020 length:279 start_codon:yes stop_codon:yes gene_type:complete
MNSTNFIIDNTTSNILSSFTNLDPECFGGYYTIILAILLFISEAMPFIKAKSKCNEVADEQQPTIEKKDSIMTEANGLAHILMAVYEKSKYK